MPSNRCPFAIAPPGGQEVPQLVDGADSPVQTLADEHRELAFGNVEPTSMFRGVMDLEAMGQPSRLFGGICFVEAGGGVDVEVVAHQTDLGRRRVDVVRQVPQKRRTIHRRSTLGGPR